MTARTLDELYTAVEELIAELNSLDRAKLAGALSYRLHNVAWTTSSELLEELRSLLTEASRGDGEHLPVAVEQKVRYILSAIERFRSSRIDRGTKWPTKY
jgi:hypothetical protein